MNLYTDVEILQTAINNLGIPNTRERSLTIIKAHVESAIRELSLESFAKFEKELYEQVFALVHSDHSAEKQGGIRAIRELINCPSATAEAKAVQFSNALSIALKTNTDFALLELVADALGHMAKYAPVSHLESVESELTRALEWLRGGVPHRRLAACAVLHQLAENAPTIFFVRCKEFFELIWGPLRDSKEPIRLCAARALSACLSALEQRTYHLQWYCCVYEQVLLGFAQATPEAVHGSLLVVAELLKHTGEFMIPRYKEVCVAVLQLRDHRSKVVRASLINLIPRLSEYCRDAFVRLYLDDSLDILIKCMKTPELRGVSLLSIGRLCRTMGSHLSYRVEELVAIVREALVCNTNKKAKEIPSEALKCVSDMVCGLGVSFHYRVLGLLDAMLQAGLTQELIEALAVIASNMPMHKEVVHQRLLGEIIKVLGGVTLGSGEQASSSAPKTSRLWPFRSSKTVDPPAPEAPAKGTSLSHKSHTPGSKKAAAPHRVRKSFAPVVVPSGGPGNLGGVDGGLGVQSTALSVAGPADLVGTGGSSMILRDEVVPKPRNYNSDLVLLAMRTLRMLSTPSSGLLVLVHRYVLPFLMAKEEIVREEAAVTAAKLISPTAQSCSNRGPTADAVEIVLSRLLEVTVVDSSVVVRMKVLKSVDKYFDRHLGQMHHLSTLMYLTSDENFDIRVTAIELLGKLADKNPAIVLPNMRQVFKHLISQLQTGPDTRLKEEAALTICVFFRSVPLHRIVTPFVRTMIHALPLDTDVRLTTAGMEALGELCQVMRQNMLLHADELLPIIIMNLHDRSSKKKQEVAARTLGQLVSASGLVVAPYLQYPQLLPDTLELLGKGVASVPWTLRREILRTLGLIGALDPRKYEHVLGQLSTTNREKDSTEISLTKICRSNVGELYLGEGTVRKWSEDATQTEHTDSTIRVTKWQRDRSGSMARGDVEDDTTPKNAHTEALVRAAIQINGVEADMPSHRIMYELTVMRAQSYPTAPDVPRLTPSSEDYYPRVAISCLMKILRDSTLSVHHPSVTQAIMFIFKFLGMQSVQYLEEILPYLLQVLRKCSPGLRESLLHQISMLASIAQYHLAPYMDTLFEVISEFWSEHSEHVLELVEYLSKYVNEEIRRFVPRILNLLISSLVVPKSEYSQRSTPHAPVAQAPGTVIEQLSYLSMKKLKRLLRCISAMRLLLTPHLDLVIPAICKLIHQLQELKLFAHELVAMCVRTLYLVSIHASLLDCPHVVSRAIHTLIRTLEQTKSVCSARQAQPIYLISVKFACAAASQLERRFLVFDRSLRDVFNSCKIDMEEYDSVIQTIKSGRHCAHSFPFEDDIDIDIDTLDEDSPSTLSSQFSLGVELLGDSNNDKRDGFKFVQDSTLYRGSNPGAMNGVTKHSINQQQLQKAWDVSQRSTASDWNAWFRRFSVQMLIESPSPAMRACAVLAQAYFPLARELFQAAFVSCWNELNDQYQENLVRSLHIAFHSSTIPPEILLVLLNLAEFMEHDVDALPIDPRTLAELAEKSHAYAKALHYRELEFRTSPSTCFESLININKKLSLYDSAYGVLRMVQKRQEMQQDFEVAVHEDWLANLGRWDEALKIYEKNLSVDPTDNDSILGKAKCLNAIGKWEDALELLLPNIDRMEAKANKYVSVKASIIGARAAWTLNRWDTMDSFVQRLPADNTDSTFMKAVLAVHNEDFDTSAVYIDRTRKHLDDNMTALLAESYSRAYVSFVMTQQLSELEEIIEYKLLLKQTGLPRKSSGSVGSASSLSQLDTGFANTGGTYRQRGAQGAIISHQNSEESLPDATGYGTTRHMLAADVGNRKAFLIDKWRKRIRGCLSSGKAAIPHWQRLLNLRRMVAGEREDVDTWLDFATLCRHSDNLPLAQRVLGLAVDDHLNASLLENFVPSPAGGLNASSLSPYPNISSPLPMPPYLRASGSYGSQGHGLNTLENTAQNAAGKAHVDTHALAVDYRIELEKLRLKWSLGHKKYAAEQLTRIVGQLSRSSSLNTPSLELSSVHLKCLLKLGDWKVRLLGPGVVMDQKTRVDIIQLYCQATRVNPKSYQAWHEWGLANLYAVQEHSELRSNGLTRSDSATLLSRRLRRPSIPVEHIQTFVENALRGLFHAISLGTSKSCASVMQDMLCVLNFWFKYGEHPDVAEVVRHGLATSPLDSWLGVLPQLIARIHHEGDIARWQLHELLGRLGTCHAQALMYPLSVALQSPRTDRKEAAELLLLNMRQHSAKLIDQSVLVSQELIRIAILWDEEWYATLEDASRLYFGEGNIQGMLDLLLPLHDKVSSGPNTNSEVAFCQAYGSEIREAFNCLQAYQRIMAESNKPIPTSGAVPSARSAHIPMSREETCLAQAWDIYIPVFKRIHPMLRQITSHNLVNVSPALLKASNLDLAVPGTYTLHGEAVRIQSFRAHVAVITSKQLPRKIRLVGHNGLEYVFLLKGHEDLRQDERAMQLFGLVNALLQHDRRTEDYDLDIQRYAVVPLSPNVGLVGWVPRCDTLHDLIRSYRDRKKVMLDVEHRLMNQLCPTKLYESLSSIQKLEVFEYALKNTSGEDLHKILWYYSTSSESWIIRRGQYTKSLAVMSVVGYVLGLGDRHPSNLMLERSSCKILHIDFGDCFEVAMHRDKFPEKIPFRLTRMLVMAMEVSGIEGTFRLTCERVMKVMRENRDSLIAVLEAFVHDPLISWRLLNPNRDNTIRGPESKKRTAHKSTSSVDGSTAPPGPTEGDHSLRQRPDQPTKPADVSPPADIPQAKGVSAAPTTVASNVNPAVPRARLTAIPSHVLQEATLSRMSSDESDMDLDNASDMEGSPKAQRTHAYVHQHVPSPNIPVQRTAVFGTPDEGQDLGGSRAPVQTKEGEGGESGVTHVQAQVQQSDVGDYSVGDGETLGLEYDVVTVERTRSDSMCRKSSYRPNAHLELMNMAASTSLRRSVSASVDKSVVYSIANTRHRSESTANMTYADGTKTSQIELTDKAVTVVHRVMDKLTGLDFHDSSVAVNNKPALDISEQIDRLIKQATSNENLSSCFSGWCAFW